MTVTIINEKQLLDRIQALNNPFFKEYYAFYSSWLGGVITDPRWMLLPIDDHMVHRGDGVFEAMKAVNRSIYLMDEHLSRLMKSAKSLALNLSFDRAHIQKTVLETLRIANQSDVLIRIFLSRGPGNFSVNPYDSIEAQLYIMISALIPPSLDQYTNGLRIGKSAIPSKPAWMAQIKSCNYLPNVLMKKEAVDRGLDYVVSLDEEGNVTECATENILIVDQSGTIIHPPLPNILSGTTMIRVCELAREHGFNTAIKPISLTDLASAKEVLITGTSLNVLPVIQFEDKTIGHGRPGPVAKKLNELMINDIATGRRGITY